MSFGVRCDDCGLEYAGARGWRGMAARPPRLPASPSYLRMLAEVSRFHRQARAAARDPTADRMTLGEFLDAAVLRLLPRPLRAPADRRVWSSGPAQIARVPGPLPVPLLRKPRHADRAACAALADGHRRQPRVCARGPRARWRRRAWARLRWRRSHADADGVVVGDADGRERAFDGVVIATHADQALRLLGRSDRRRSGRCCRGSTTRRTRRCCTPTARAAAVAAARAHPGTTCSTPAPRPRPPVHVSYHMNRLQAPRRADRLLRDAEPDRTDRAESESAADGRTSTRSTRPIRSRRSAGCPRCPGARHGLLRRVPRLGLPRGRLRLGRRVPRWRWGAPGDRRRRSTRAQVMHTRPPARRATLFRHGIYLWLVDLDEPPRLPRRCAASPGPRRDHLGDPDAQRSARTSTRSWPTHGIDLDGGRVLMLTNARVLGLRLQPADRVLVPRAATAACAASLPRCTTPTASATATCCGRATRGRGEADKEFYVSPFLTVDGRYRMSFSEPGERLSVQMELHQDGARVFAASLTGRRRPLTAGEPGADGGAPSADAASASRG